ncbi:MAG: single-stranded DNA-binding protein, partial [Candidatus Dormibacteria bacterium]
GRLVFVEGRLQTRTWETDGVTHRRTEIVASRVQFLDSAKAAEVARPQTVGAGVAGDVDPEDVPF